MRCSELRARTSGGGLLLRVGLDLSGLLLLVPVRNSHVEGVVAVDLVARPALPLVQRLQQSLVCEAMSNNQSWDTRSITNYK